MSFDQEQLDPHGECGHEIHQLQNRVAELEGQLEARKDATQFETYWTVESIGLRSIQDMPLSRARFFDLTRRSSYADECSAIIPDDMPYMKLTKFIGKKTRVTIEVIP